MHASDANPQTPQPRRDKARAPSNLVGRLFYTSAAALLLVLTIVGFQQFFLRGRAYPDRELTPPIRTLIVLHGVAMSGWMALAMTQPLLIAARRPRIHMALGRVGACLAICLFLLGARLGIEAARVNPPDLKVWGLTQKQFLAVPVVGITVYAVFVAAGVWLRKRAAWHRPLMLMASLSVVAAAVSRIDAISSLYQGTIWESIFGPFFGTVAIGAMLCVAHALATRTIDRRFLTAYALFVASCAMIVQLATTSAWDRFATTLL